MIDVILGGIIVVILARIGMKIRGELTVEEEQDIRLAREVRRLRNYSDT